MRFWLRAGNLQRLLLERLVNDLGDRPRAGQGGNDRKPDLDPPGHSKQRGLEAGSIMSVDEVLSIHRKLDAVSEVFAEATEGAAVSRRHWRRGELIVVTVCLLSLGCGSSASSAPPAPIPDPGGPFHTSVPPNTSLDALTNDQLKELCSEVSAGEQAYGLDGITWEDTCRTTGIEGADFTAGNHLSAGTRDGGADDGWLSACQAAYDDCETAPRHPPPCGLPTGCGATVELLSACLNEIANTDPVAACVTTPTCAMAAATPTTPWGDPGPCPQLKATTINPTGGSVPSLPACVRLGQECPTATSLIPYSPYG